MPLEVRWRKKAYAQLQKLPPALASRIVEKIERTRNLPDHFLERLEDTVFFKLRVGKCRVLVDWRKKENTLDILYIEKRSKIYQRFRGD